MKPFRTSFDSSPSQHHQKQQDRDHGVEEEDFGVELAVLLNKRASIESGRSSFTASRPPLPPREHSHSRRPHPRRPFSQWTPLTFLVYRNTATFLLVTYSLVCVFALYWIAKFLLLRHDAYAHTVFSPPMIPSPTPVHSPPFDRSIPSTSPSAIQSELNNRLLSLDLPIPTLPCIWTDREVERYDYLRSAGRGPYYFAINLWNNQAVLPTLSRSLLSLAFYLGPSNVHISIFENGSTDNTTAVMGHLSSALSHVSVPHTIVSDPRKTNWKRVDRIAQLSVYREEALRSLREHRGKAFEDVVFVNDVYMCPRDALELLHQRRNQEAHAACALDWRATKSWIELLGYKSVKFYDNWVSRTITGDMFRSRFDMLAETRDGVEELFDQPGSEMSRRRFQAGVPVPVYSCWNGMLALDAKPFSGDNSSRIKFRSALNSPGECAASECKTVARDFWAKGFKRWLIVPSVHVSYVEEVYSHPSLQRLTALSLSPPKPSKPSSHEPEQIDWNSLEEPQDVVCYAYRRGFHVDLPSARTREPPYRR